ncbi:MAG: hypothetical protein Q8P72_04580 [Candidatus Roizmanbacteria bacterium]|nr:hypothetical protein [Candidatus Roizmanbacteria bacterium]
MGNPFITKVEKKRENHTPIDIKKMTRPQAPSESHTAVIKKKEPKMSHIPFEFDKYILMTIISVLFFVSGLGFWIYVNFFMNK